MDKIRDWIYSKKDEITQILSELVEIPSVMGAPEEGAPFGSEPKNALLKMCRICSESGFAVTNYENAVGCADLGGSPELAVLCHLDVVPVNRAGWDTDPFTLTERDGVLYGRGAIDDKGPAVAALYAMKCLKELGIPLKKGVRLIFGTNEENGSEDLEIYKKHDKFPPRVFTPDGSFPVINIEKGMMRSRFSGRMSENGSVIAFHGGSIPNAVPDRAEVRLRGEFSENDIQNAAKAYNGAEFEVSAENGETRIVCTGKAAHASTPEGGANAVTALISLVCGLIGEPILSGLSRIFPFGETDGAALGMKCSDESGALTCVLSILDIARGECSGTVDVRFPTCMTLSSVEQAERAAFGQAGLDFAGFMGDEPHIVPETTAFVRTLMRVYERVEGEKGYCVAIGGGTYVHNIEGGVAFGAERGDTDYHMHGDNEFITVDELLRDAILFAEVIREVCG